MPAKTSVKVAIINNAAKDDYFGDLDWLVEDGITGDGVIQGTLGVLGNDPGSARIIGWSDNLPTLGSQLTNHGPLMGGKLLVSINPLTGGLDVDASALNGDLQNLAEGQEVEFSFYYTVQMANGAYSTAKVTFTVTGANDAPELEGAAASLADSAAFDDFAELTGQLHGSDVDQGAVLGYGLAAGEDGLRAYGALTVASDGVWTFTPDDAAINALKTTELLTFAVAVTDEHGAVGTSTVEITLEGANDSATITGVAAAEVAEDGGGYVVGGTLAVNDADTGDALFAAVAPGALAGAYGAFTFAGGAWSYTLDNASAAVQALNGGVTVYDELVVASADGTATETIKVAIHGANDAPPYVSPPVFTGTGDPNDFDNLGNSDGQTLSGGGGNNIIYGGAGNDTINGNNGDDLIYGGSGGDGLNGNNDIDTLYGGSGNDTILGGNANDVIIGGYGADTLTGNNGSDRFVYLDAKDTGDTITDFTQGTDKIDLSAFSPSTFVGVLSSAGAVGAGQVGYIVNGGVTTIYVDTNNVYGADLGSGLVDQSQKMTVAAMQMAEKKV